MHLHLLLWMISIVLCLSVTDIATAIDIIPCRLGWFHYDKKCYKIFGEDRGLNWKQASVSCSLHGGKLASITSAELQEFLLVFLLFRLQNNAWIGLHDRVNESEFTWDDLSPVNYTNWDQNQPSRRGTNRQEEDCVEMRFHNTRGKIGTWNDESCDTERPYFCEVDESADVSSKDPRICFAEEEGWTYSNSCYHVVTEAMSWEDAEYYCKERFKGHLVSILDDKVEMFLNYLLPNHNENFWIGIKMQNQSAQVWSSGWHVFYKKWDHDPTHFLENTCGMMSKENLWTIGPCFRKLPFICEKSKNEAPVLKESPKGWQCPDLSEEWVDLNGDHCYIFETSKSLNWYEANYECGRKGGNLASIRSKEESYILHHRVRNSQERIFIGLHRSLSDKNVFEWADGSTFDFQDWDEGEPNDRSEECGEIWTDRMKWNDIPCNMKKGYICSAKKMPPINLDITDINASERNEFVHTSGASSESATVVTVCILLLVVVFLGIVVYNYRDFFKRKFNSSYRNSNDPQSFSYISSERILKP